jgi:Zn-finger nucleic acid-binding protein
VDKEELELLIESERVIQAADWWSDQVEKLMKEIELIEAEGFTQESQKRYDQLGKQLKTFMARKKIEFDALNKIEKKVTKYLKGLDDAQD